MVEAVIFDMDGTLLDTLEDLKEGVNYVMNKFGFPQKTKEEVRNFVGNGVNMLFERALPINTDDNTKTKCILEFKKYYYKNMYNSTKPYIGICEILKEIKQNGLKIAVVSNKFDHAVKELSKRYFENLIDVVVGQADDVPQKPAPNGVLKAIKNLGIKSAIYVGDSDVDVQTAKNAKLLSIGVTWGFRDRENLKDADFIIDSPNELMQVLKTLKNY